MNCLFSFWRITKAVLQPKLFIVFSSKLISLLAPWIDSKFRGWFIEYKKCFVQSKKNYLGFGKEGLMLLLRKWMVFRYLMSGLLAHILFSFYISLITRRLYKGVMLSAVILTLYMICPSKGNQGNNLLLYFQSKCSHWTLLLTPLGLSTPNFKWFTSLAAR